MQLYGAKDAEHERVERDSHNQYPAARVDLVAQAAEHAPMDQDIHHQVEEGAERCDAAEIKKHRQDSRNHHGVNQRVLADRTGHAEMTVGDHLHVGQHRQHARDGKDTGEQPRGGRDNSKRDGEIETVRTEGRFGCLRERIVFRGDDLVERETGTDRERDQQIDHHANRD